MGRGLLVLVCLLAPAVAAAPPEAAEREVLFDAGQLGRALLPEAELYGAWDVVEEAVVDPGGDPDLVSWGVRAQRARHYTRDGRAGIQVCSVELWAFESERQAAAAHAGLSFPDWQFERKGSVLLMLRAVTRKRQSRPRRGVFPECHALGRKTLARVARFSAAP